MDATVEVLLFLAGVETAFVSMVMGGTGDRVPAGCGGGDRVGGGGRCDSGCTCLLTTAGNPRFSPCVGLWLSGDNVGELAISRLVASVPAEFTKGGDGEDRREASSSADEVDDESPTSGGGSVSGGVASAAVIWTGDSESLSVELIAPGF